MVSQRKGFQIHIKHHNYAPESSKSFSFSISSHPDLTDRVVYDESEDRYYICSKDDDFMFAVNATDPKDYTVSFKSLKLTFGEEIPHRESLKKRLRGIDYQMLKKLKAAAKKEFERKSRLLSPTCIIDYFQVNHYTINPKLTSTKYTYHPSIF